MKLNKKFVKYLKDGSMVTPEVYGRLNVLKDIYTSDQSEYSWYEYAIDNMNNHNAQNEEMPA